MGLLALVANQHPATVLRGGSPLASAKPGPLAGAIGAFGADVRAGMNEREEELTDVVAQRSGVTPGYRPARVESPLYARHDARARRADG